MPDFTTVFRDYGVMPTIVTLGFLALLVYCIVGPKKGNRNGNGTGNGTTGSTPSTPTTPTQNSSVNTGAGQQPNPPSNGTV